MEMLIDLFVMLESRIMRWLLAVLVVALLGLDIWIVSTGIWPNIGSAPLGAGCRYWTGFRLVHRPDLDGANCPLHVDRADWTMSRVAQP